MYKLPYKPIESVTFQPWIGKNYKKRIPKLFIAGMSHYSWPGSEEIPEYFITNEVILDRISGKCRDAIYTNIVATCIGKLPNDDERKGFWQSVAFYNYIQEFVGDAPRQRHPYVLWERGEAAFAAVLQRLKPQLILVVGRTNWDNISNLKGWNDKALSDAPAPRYAETFRYPIDKGSTALAFHVRHTSSGYNFETFAPLFRSASATFLKTEKAR